MLDMDELTSVTVRISEDLKRRLRLVAAFDNESLTAVAEKGILREVERREKKRSKD